MSLRNGFLLAVFLLASGDSSAREIERPRVGIALGGGAARGIAHIGFLEWLEEHRVPVDIVAGTSMGGLIGGAYASGMSTEELRALMRDMDWDLVFLADSPFKYKNFRRKEDARSYPSQIEAGLKGGLRFPTGMNPGQQIELTLDRIAAPYGELASFDDLPIPFRCVAVDLRSREEVVLAEGSLALAMRATMAIPGLFTPVEMGERLLVDGGALDNVPADIAREMGAEVVIAVNVGSATDDPPPPEDMFAVLGQTIDVMMAEGVAKALESATVVVTPDLRGLTGLDWRKSDELADRGYAAAETMKAELLDHAVDETVYQAWQNERTRRRRRDAPVLTFVRVEGIPENLADRVESTLAEKLVGERFDATTIDRQILLLSGTDRYSIIRYRVEHTEEGAGVVVTATVKAYGPPFLLPAIDVENVDANNFAMNLRARIVFFDTLVPNSEIRVDAALGTRVLGRAELYQHLGRTPLFIAPRIYWDRRHYNIFNDESVFVAEYRETTAAAAVDLGLELGYRSQLRFGYELADVDLARRIGEPSRPEAGGANRFLSLRWTFDGQTSPMIPSHGVYVRTGAAHFFSTPDLFVGDVTLPGPQDFDQAEMLVSAFRSTRGEHRLFLAGSGGTSFGDDPGINAFELGGLLRLGAFQPGELRGSNYLLGQAGALFRVLRLPDVVGANGYLGAWLESGSVFEDWERAHVEWQVSGGLILETILGPIFVGGSVSLNDGGGRFYFNVGPFLLAQASTFQ